MSTWSPRATMARAILVVMSLIMVFAAYRLLSYALSGETNVDIVSAALHPCVATRVATTTRMALLRIDDIQAYAWAEISLRMMDDAKARGVPLVLGVIPKGISDDGVMYSYLRENRCYHEIALHGWDHGSETSGEVPEFRGATYDEALADIERGKIELETLAREKITTFIPPNNEMSVETYRAIETLKIPVISSAGPARFDFHATTFDYKDDVLTSADHVIEDCATRTNSNDLCVVMIHPQDFTSDGRLDETKYRIYLDTMDRLAAQGYTFIRFKDLVEFDRSYASWERFLLPSIVKTITE